MKVNFKICLLLFLFYFGLGIIKQTIRNKTLYAFNNNKEKGGIIDTPKQKLQHGMLLEKRVK